MLKKLILPLAGVAAFIIAVGFLVANSGNLKFKGLPSFQPSTLPMATVTVAGKNIQVEIAKNEADRELGLGGRSYLAPDNGMLFIFDSKGVTPTFWMKGMLFPLDIIWISGGKVVKIDKNAAVESTITPDDKLKLYNPNSPIDYVLEVNSGFSDTNNVTVGSTVVLNGI